MIIDAAAFVLVKAVSLVVRDLPRHRTWVLGCPHTADLHV